MSWLAMVLMFSPPVLVGLCVLQDTGTLQLSLAMAIFSVCLAKPVNGAARFIGSFGGFNVGIAPSPAAVTLEVIKELQGPKRSNIIIYASTDQLFASKMPTGVTLRSCSTIKNLVLDLWAPGWSPEEGSLAGSEWTEAEDGEEDEESQPQQPGGHAEGSGQRGREHNDGSREGGSHGQADVEGDERRGEADERPRQPQQLGSSRHEGGGQGRGEAEKEEAKQVDDGMGIEEEGDEDEEEGHGFFRSLLRRATNIMRFGEAASSRTPRRTGGITNKCPSGVRSELSTGEGREERQQGEEGRSSSDGGDKHELPGDRSSPDTKQATQEALEEPPPRRQQLQRRWRRAILDDREATYGRDPLELLGGKWRHLLPSRTGSPSSSPSRSSDGEDTVDMPGGDAEGGPVSRPWLCDAKARSFLQSEGVHAGFRIVHPTSNEVLTKPTDRADRVQIEVDQRKVRLPPPHLPPPTLPLSATSGDGAEAPSPTSQPAHHLLRMLALFGSRRSEARQTRTTSSGWKTHGPTTSVGQGPSWPPLRGSAACETSRLLRASPPASCSR